jgi:hypothetical protein
MRNWMRSLTGWALLSAVPVFSAACSEEENTLDPTLVTITDLPDVFMFSVTGLDNVTDHERFLWTMTGDQATVDITSGLTGGSAFLQMRGGNGQVAYAEDIRSEVDGTTDVSLPGLWQIDIVLDKADGEFSISLERDTIP